MKRGKWSALLCLTLAFVLCANVCAAAGRTDRKQINTYLIGASASFDLPELEKYWGGRFYNLCTDDRLPGEWAKLVRPMVEKKIAQRIVLVMGVETAAEDRISQDIQQRGKAAAPAAGEEPETSEDLPEENVRELSVEELLASQARDLEKVGELEPYLTRHEADFAPAREEPEDLINIHQWVEAATQLRSICRNYNVELIVLFAPIYEARWTSYTRESLEEYRRELARFTDYWDFACTSLSWDSRYFYDDTRFRSSVGTMMMARILGGDQVYYPPGFGTYVTSRTVNLYLEGLFNSMDRPDPETYTKEVPILMYHHLDPEPEGEFALSPQVFERHLQALQAAGFQTVSPQELIDYVYLGKELPERPVFITFDDGYLSNYQLAYPLLQKYGMKATMFIIGSSVGAVRYKDTSSSVLPHFTYAQAREMAQSGLVTIQTHTYDMHQWGPLEADPDQARTTVAPLPGETQEEFMAAVTQDLTRAREELLRKAGISLVSMAYPGGNYSDASELAIHQLGILLTVSTKTDSRNVLVKGLPQSLYALCRWNVMEQTSPEELLALIQGK